MKILGFNISEDNKKMNGIPSFSLPPLKTCAPGVPCSKGCYALRMVGRLKTVRESYENNLTELLRAGGYQRLKDAINTYLYIRPSRFFRWHVAGDIFSTNYLRTINDIAESNPETVFLMYTKQYQRVNHFYWGANKPDNLIIIYSNWLDWRCENPYNFPTSELIVKGLNESAEGFICPGDCSHCLKCYHAKQGDVIKFYKH